MKTLERDIMRQVADCLRLFGLAEDVVRRNTGGMRNERGRYVAFGRAGDPDYAGTLPDGRTIGIEVKRPGERPTPTQFAVLRRLNELGGVGFWADDPVYLAKVLPVILAGGWCEIREDGEPIFHVKGDGC